MNNYLLFAGDNYYPSGGWEDFIGSFSTQEEAQDVGADKIEDEFNWYHVVDLSSGNIVAKGRRSW